jgi:Flp pilus assembly protein TadG
VSVFRRQRAQTLVLFALALPALLAMIGLGIDFGVFMGHRQRMQAAADMAVLSGIYCFYYNATKPSLCPTSTAFATGSTNAERAATSMARVTAKANGYEHGGDVTVTVTTPSSPDRVRVQIATNNPTLFLQAIGFRNFNLSVAAEATTATGSNGEYAIYAYGRCPTSPSDGLDFSGNTNAINGAIHGNGNLKNSGNNNGTSNSNPVTNATVTYDPACAVTQWRADGTPNDEVPAAHAYVDWPYNNNTPFSFATLSSGGIDLSSGPTASKCPSSGSCDLDIEDSAFASYRKASVDADCRCSGGSLCSYQLVPGAYYFRGAVGGSFVIKSVNNGLCAKNVTFVSENAKLVLGQKLYVVGRNYTGSDGRTIQVAGASFYDGDSAITFDNNINGSGIWQAHRGQIVISGNSGNDLLYGGLFAETVKISGNAWEIRGSGVGGAPGGSPLMQLVE